MKPKHRRLGLLLFSLTCLGGAAAFVLQAFEENVVFFITPSEIADGTLPDRRVRMGGVVADGTVERDAETMTVRFVITDHAAHIPAEYTGIVPVLFREGQGVVADGAFMPDGTFRADTLLTKHDENYMPPEVMRALQQSGHWNHPEKTYTP